MRAWWRKVAECADNANFEVQRVSELLFDAVMKDFRRDVPAALLRALREAFHERDRCLFIELRRDVVAFQLPAEQYTSLAAMVLDCANHELELGNTGSQGISAAVESALGDQMSRAARQIEEHYLRKGGNRRSAEIRQRLKEARGGVPVSDVSSRVLGTVAAPRIACAKEAGLEDGVPLS